MNGVASRILVGMLLMGSLLWSAPARADSYREAVQRVRKSMDVFQSMAVAGRGEAIPPAVLSQSYGVAIFPGIVRAGLIFGAQHGKGVLLAHRPGESFSDPVFITLTGGSFGAEVGGEQVNVIMVLNNERALNSFVAKGLEFGTDVVAEAGPTEQGKTTQKADVFVYREVKGAFVGASLTGVTIHHDGETTNNFYGGKVDATRVLDRSTKLLRIPKDADRLRRMLEEYTAKA